MAARRKLVEQFQATVDEARQQLAAGQPVSGVIGSLITAQDENGNRRERLTCAGTLHTQCTQHEVYVCMLSAASVSLLMRCSFAALNCCMLHVANEHLLCFYFPASLRLLSNRQYAGACYVCVRWLSHTSTLWFSYDDQTYEQICLHTKWLAFGWQQHSLLLVVLLTGVACLQLAVNSSLKSCHSAQQALLVIRIVQCSVQCPSTKGWLLCSAFLVYAPHWLLHVISSWHTSS